MQLGLLEKVFPQILVGFRLDDAGEIGTVFREGFEAVPGERVLVILVLEKAVRIRETEGDVALVVLDRLGVEPRPLDAAAELAHLRVKSCLIWLLDCGTMCPF